jgi:hypothetical protein
MGTPTCWGCHWARRFPIRQHFAYHSEPMPIVNKRHLHGRTRSDYFRGCRCDECRKAESDYQRKRRQAIKAGTWVGRGTTTDEQEET